jgi:hypothetical protein
LVDSTSEGLRGTESEARTAPRWAILPARLRYIDWIVTPSVCRYETAKLLDNHPLALSTTRRGTNLDSLTGVRLEANKDSLRSALTSLPIVLHITRVFLVRRLQSSTSEQLIQLGKKGVENSRVQRD